MKLTSHVDNLTPEERSLNQMDKSMTLFITLLSEQSRIDWHNDGVSLGIPMPNNCWNNVLYIASIKLLLRKKWQIFILNLLRYYDVAIHFFNSDTRTRRTGFQ